MPTLSELHDQFAKTAAVPGDAPTTTRPAVVDGSTKLASGENHMNSLTDIYLQLTNQDFAKEAAAAAHQPEVQPTGEDIDFAKMAEQLAEQEAQEQTGGGDQEATDMVKVAQEYDSAGRIMARGFYDEFCKLAENMTTTESDNQRTERESEAKTPALGNRGLPTLETNYAGTPNNDKQPPMTGPGPKQVYADSLKTTKTISAGQGTGDDPEGAAISIGGGSPAGFATVRDLKA
jgi:hypothetical protein